MRDNKIQIDLEYVANIIKEADKYSLTPEVVLWALSAMKADPSLEIDEAIRIGFDEWVK